MNTISRNIRSLGIVFAMALVAVLSFAVAPKAHATWDDIGGYIPFDDYGGWYTDYATPFYDFSYGGGDYGGWYTDYATPVYDFDYGGGWYTDYATPFYDYGGYGSGFPMSYGSGGGFPFTFGGGGGMPSFTNVNQNQNTNTCTAGSCNTSTAINAPTTIAYPPTYQQPVYQPPVYQQPPMYPQQPTYQQPRAPYVSLSAVPYTGLEMGPVATALYWGFLVLWCLIAAYLIAVKKVHYKVAAWFAGSNAAAAHTNTHTVTAVRHSEPTVQRVNRVPASQLAGIDPFIASQINRS